MTSQLFLQLCISRRKDGRNQREGWLETLRGTGGGEREGGFYWRVMVARGVASDGGWREMVGFIENTEGLAVNLMHTLGKVAPLDGLARRTAFDPHRETGRGSGGGHEVGRWGRRTEGGATNTRGTPCSHETSGTHTRQAAREHGPSEKKQPRQAPRTSQFGAPFSLHQHLVRIGEASL